MFKSLGKVLASFVSRQCWWCAAAQDLSRSLEVCSDIYIGLGSPARISSALRPHSQKLMALCTDESSQNSHPLMILRISSDSLL